MTIGDDRCIDGCVFRRGTLWSNLITSLYKDTILFLNQTLQTLILLQLY